MENKNNHEVENPMAKNNLGEGLPSRNERLGETTELRTAAGAPVDNNQDSMTAGKRGPALMQDVWMMQKLAHFNREVIPETRL